MVSTEVLAPYVLNEYVLELLFSNNALNRLDYDANTEPLIPGSQQPEMIAHNKPFLVYGFSEDSTPDLYARRGGSVAYAVYHTLDRTVNNILNVIRIALERHDESASNINLWSTVDGRFIGVRFANTHVSYFESPSPEDSEGGRRAGFITIRYQYFIEQNVKLFNPDGSWA